MGCCAVTEDDDPAPLREDAAPLNCSTRLSRFFRGKNLLRAGESNPATLFIRRVLRLGTPSVRASVA